MSTRRTMKLSLLILVAVAAVAIVAAAALAARGSGPVPGTWRKLPAAPFTVGAGLTSVWTGREMLVSGRPWSSRGTFASAAAAAYNPRTRTWRRLPPPPKTDSLCRLSAVWTGKEMLVWGCRQVAFNPLTSRWRRLPTAPSGQGIVVWTGREMVGWGGGCCGDANSGGSAYNPATNTWRKLARSPLAPEQRPIGAWTGRELILLASGVSAVDSKPLPQRFARAAAYNPTTDSWRRIASLPQHGVRFVGTAVWDGREMLVVATGAEAQSAFAFNPATNRWRRLASIAPGHIGAYAAWTGKRLLLWGGTRYDPEHGDVPAAHGLAYDLRTNRWSRLPQWPLRRRSGSSVVWTGRSLLVWGGVVGSPIGTNIEPKYLADGAAFTPRP